MLYDDLIGYSQTGVSYEGSLTLTIPGFSNLLLPPSIAIFIGDEEDFSNVTTIGLLTIDSIKTGSITLQSTQAQAMAIAQASVIILNKTASASVQSSSLEEGSVVQVSVVSTKAVAEQNLA